jgi:hypothetical protein
VRFLSDPAFRVLSTPDRDATGDAGGARPL